MRFDVVTLFEGMFDALTAHGIPGRAHQRELWRLRCWNPRTFTHDARNTVDDRPYGGGPGMVMMAEPLAAAIDAAMLERTQAGMPAGRVICLTPGGAPVRHEHIRSLVPDGAILLCGRYEGIDQRLMDTRVDEQWSVGDFVVSGGELPAMMLIDAAVRLLPGALNDERSAEQESFATGLLDWPHYTRPEVFRGLAVPEVLRSGHHRNIARWRRDQALLATARHRPDLLAQARQAGLLEPADERALAAGLAGADAPSAARPVATAPAGNPATPKL